MGGIKGKITNNGLTPIPGVNIILKGTTYGTASDEDGFYEISNIQPGSYTIVVSAIGYESISSDLIIQQNQAITKDFELKISAIDLQTVEIIGRKETSYKSNFSFSGTKTSTRIKDIPQTISYVTKELIDDQFAYRTVDIIKNVSGVNHFSRYDDFSTRE
jgi:iron complex outermembrane receptor protein